MAIPKWNKQGLKWMDEQGYKIVPCKDEKEAEETRDFLKANKRCAQAGFIVNKEGKDIYFVLTKERGKNKIGG